MHNNYRQSDSQNSARFCAKMIGAIAQKRAEFWLSLR
jgi:hypothetical protein